MPLTVFLIDFLVIHKLISTTLVIYVFHLYLDQEQYLEYCSLVLGNYILSFLTPAQTWNCAEIHCI